MVRVEDLNLTFFHIPKNAGSSIATWLTKNLDGEEYHDEFRHATPDRLKPIFEDFGWTFACVRNPWERVVSWYNFFKKQGKMPLTFEQYMEKIIANQTSEKYIKTPGTQSSFLEVDHIIRYENLHEDFKVVQEKTNCYIPLGHHNKSVDFDYKKYYVKDTWIDYIHDQCADEIYLLNYKFGG